MALDLGLAVLGGSVLSGLFGGSAAKSAARSSANAQLQAAELAAREQRFRPYGMRTLFGESKFGYEIPGEAPPTEPVQGPQESDADFAARVAAFPQQVADYERRARTEGVATSYGYERSPEIAAMQRQLMAAARQGVSPAISDELYRLRTSGRGLFSLGQELMPGQVSREADPQALALAQRYGRLGGSFEDVGRQLGTDLGISPDAAIQGVRLRNLAAQITPTSYDPNAAARQYYEESLGLMEPGRAREEARLGQSVFGRGRAGLSVGGQGQPELFALSQARAEQDAALAAASRERARQELQQDIGLGTSLGEQALGTQRAAEQYRLGQVQTGLGLRQGGAGLFGQGLSTRQAAEELARQRFAQDLALSQQATQGGLGMFSAIPQYQVQAMAPFQTQFGLLQNLEAASQEPLRLSAELGGRSAQAGAAAGQTMLQGGLGAAQTRLQGSLVGPTMLAGATNAMLSNPYLMQGMFNQPGGGYGTPPIAPTYYGPQPGRTTMYT